MNYHDLEQNILILWMEQFKEYSRKIIIINYESTCKHIYPLRGFYYPPMTLMHIKTYNGSMLTFNFHRLKLSKIYIVLSKYSKNLFF